MPADLLRGDGLGLEQRGYRLTGLAALGMSAGHVDQHPGPAFGRQPLVSTAAAARSARPASPSSTAIAISYSRTLAGPNSVLYSLCPSPSRPAT